MFPGRVLSMWTWVENCTELSRRFERLIAARTLLNLPGAGFAIANLPK